MPTLGDLVRTTARRRPDVEALVCGERRWTWREADGRVDAAAAVLAARGIGRGDRCALLAANSDAFLIAVWAVLRLGAIVVPVNTRLAPPEIAFILDDAGAAVLITDTEADLDVPTVAIAALLGAPDVAPLADGATESDDALILYTSGTTGHPKGVVLDHHREIWAGVMQLAMCGLWEADRYLHLAPLYHGAGLTLSTAMLLAGGTQVVHGAFDPDTALEAIERERITALLGVPTMFQLMLDRPGIAERDLSSFRMGIFGAAPMPAHAVERMLSVFPNAQLMQQCGLTEAGPAGIYASSEQVRARPDASGRQAFPGFEVRVLDEAGAEIETEGTGEMWLRGESVMKGYWNRPRETAEVLDDEGWLRTGDVVRVDRDGFLTVIDRLKDVIITGARNVYSVEVENAVASHPAVADCAVVARPHEEYGETIVAVVALRDGAALELDALRAHCAERIADYKLPRELVVGEVPRNPSGKILKNEVRASLPRPGPAARA